MFLISFKQAQFAYTFIDYMATKGVVLRSELDQQGNTQLFFDDNDEATLLLIKHELERYVQNPYDRRYSHAAWQNHGQHRPNMPLNGFKKSLVNLAPVGLITLAVTLICIGLYGLLFIFGSTTLLTYLGYPISGQTGQLWRYLTPIFIHFSLAHIVFNLMWWWYLGGMVERIKGKVKLIEIVLIAGVLANYAQAQISGPDFGGLSGVVYALMGYVWLYGEVRPACGLKFERAMIVIAVIWLLAGYLGMLGPIANTAHLIGLIVGLLLAAKDIWLLKK